MKTPSKASRQKYFYMGLTVVVALFVASFIVNQAAASSSALARRFAANVS